MQLWVPSYSWFCKMLVDMFMQHKSQHEAQDPAGDEIQFKDGVDRDPHLEEAVRAGGRVMADSTMGQRFKRMCEALWAQEQIEAFAKLKSKEKEKRREDWLQEEWAGYIKTRKKVRWLRIRPFSSAPPSSPCSACTA